MCSNHLEKYAYTIKIIALFVLFLLQACASNSIEARAQKAALIAGNAHLQKREISTGSFILTSYYKITDKQEPVDIYIEGDGFAWASRNRLSSNPTPRDPVMLELAAEDNSPNVIYIARPCQYTALEKDKYCAPKYWSGSRFAEIVIESTNNAVSHYASKFDKPEINMIGYSGGAAVAALVAARRDDVASLRTIAGNLDHIAVNNYHKVDNLNDSLNAIDVAKKLARVPQYHFAGSEDKIVPLDVIENFAKKSGQGNCVKVNVINGATHYSGWREIWPELLNRPVSCESQ